MSDFVKPQTTIPTDEWLAVHRLAKRYLESTDLGAALQAQQRLLEVAEVAKQQGLISKLEIWQVSKNAVSGAWRLTPHDEETGMKVEVFQLEVEKQFPEIAFSLMWLKA
jgi:hypothetical protein